MRVRDFINTGIALDASHTLSDALDTLSAGEPVFMKRASGWYLLRPSRAVGHSETRRLIDLPLEAVPAVNPNDRVMALAERSETWDYLPVEEEGLLLGYLSRQQLLDICASTDELAATLMTRLVRPLMHDLGNALTVAYSSLHAMSEDRIDGTRSENDQAPPRLALDHAVSLVRRLQQLSGRAQADEVTLNLSSLLREVTPLLRFAAERLALEVEIPREELPVRTPRHLLERVLLNLVLNAKEAATPRGRIRVSVVGATSSSARWMRLVVEDDGQGLDPAQVESLFDPDSSSKDHGRGLGLYAVRQALSRVGGRIAVCDSHLGGAAFEILLPRAGSENRSQ